MKKLFKMYSISFRLKTILKQINLAVLCVTFLISVLAVFVAVPDYAISSEGKYEGLVGEWSGIWPGMSYDRGTIIIHEVNAETKKVRITLVVDRLDTGHEEHEAIGDLTLKPVPTIKFTAAKNDFTCVYRRRAKQLDVSYEGDSRGVKMSNSCKMEKRQQVFSNIEELLEKNPLPDGKKSQAIKIAENNDVTVFLVRSTEGAGLEPHFHAEHDETLYVISGSGQLFVENRWVDLRPGSIHFNPVGKTHANKQIGTEPLVAISVFAPGMKDPDRHFIKK